MRFDRACLTLLLLLLAAGVPASAASLPCNPCAGLRLDPAVAGPAEAARALAEASSLEPGSPLFLAWEVPLAGASDAPGPGALAAEVRRAGGTPWLSLVFTTPPPLATNAGALQEELRAAARAAAGAPAGTWFQILWRPQGAEAAAFDPVEYAFLLKRAAVALTGALTEARVATGPLPADPAALETFYGQEVSAYLESVALAPAAPAALEAAVEAVGRLDPGRPVTLDALPAPADPALMLAGAARAAARGVGLTLFEAPAGAAGGEGLAAALRPLALLARELSGDLSYDPATVAAGAEESWAFVRGEDLSLRVVAVLPEQPEGTEVRLRFDDPQLKSASLWRPETGEELPLLGTRSGGDLELPIPEPGRVAVLSVERMTAAELEGVEEELTVSSEREMPVEEVLRRLQAFEDAQARRIDHYRATNTTHLRFQPAAGSQTVEATLEGPYFYSDALGADWAWQTLYVNGVRWRSKSIPEIPLVQPEKAAALPLEIHFSRQYRYRLRGTETVDGRPAWVVDFAPAGPARPGEGAGSSPESKLYQGTVWVDREVYARLRTRAVQLGLEGEVLSNEETLYYTPVDDQGRPARWSRESFVLPLRMVAQQILSVVNAATVVERETLLTGLAINDPGFEEARRQVADSDVTMVRDTDRGLRYLVKQDGSDERVVKEGFDTSKFFLLGGVFYDDALDYPLPLAGVNYFSFDFRGTGKQLNAFFAGALLTVDFADPRLFGSRFDAGIDAFALAVPLTDTLYRGDREVPEEKVEQRFGSLGFKLGRPLGNFVKLGAEYSLLRFDFDRTDETAEGFVPPASNLTHSLDLRASYARSGYRLALSGSYARRSEWEPWGFPGNPEFDPDHEDFLRWEARASKNWYLPGFQKLGFEVDYVSGSDLDRFSKYQFGFFGGTRVHGYQSNRVRAEEALAAHASYGFEIGQAFRLEGLVDAAWATDEATGLDNELLAGVGLAGTFVGPWQTVVNLDLGVPVAGPDDGFVLYVVFLKLFR